MTANAENSCRHGEIVTFYSYKGGTGRTMALSNVACVLAGTGKTVLMIDWDLEAPGLYRYFSKHLQQHFSGHANPTKAVEHHPGLIELFDELSALAPKEPVASLDADGEMVRQILDRVVTEPYILKTDVPNLSLLKSGSSAENYAQRVNQFNWESLFNRSPFLIRALIERLALSYDYVFIDSRTGMTDTSGICTMLLPEKLVIVFTPNTQSLTGVKDLIERATRYRRGSDDLRPLSIFPLPSRVESSREDLRNAWRFGNQDLRIEGYQPMFEALLQKEYDLETCSLNAYFNEVQIQQSADYAYGEEIAVLVEVREDRLSLARSYRTFTERLVGLQGPWAEQRLSSESVAICVAIMPLGRKQGKLPYDVNFDAVYDEIVHPAAEDAGLQSIRSDAEIDTEVLSRSRLELLASAPYAVVDITAANPSVIYQLGVRHALRPGCTVALFSAESGIPFDLTMMPGLSYQLRDSGTPANAPRVRAELAAWLRKARDDQSVDSPVFQLLDLKPPEIPYSADAFVERAKYKQSARNRLAAARNQGLAALHDIEKDLGPITDADSEIVLDLLVSYRAVNAWTEMIDLVGGMSPGLASTVVVREQRAFAQIRKGLIDDAEKTLALLLREKGKNSAAFNMLGHIYRDRWETAQNRDEKDLAMKWLNRAIEAYCEGFRIDSRDPRPGMNAVILLEVYGDSRKRDLVLPVVRFSLDHLKGPAPNSWVPTMLELAVVQSDQANAHRLLSDFIAMRFEPWESESTARNLRLIRQARFARGESAQWVKDIEDKLLGRQRDKPPLSVSQGPQDRLTIEARELAVRLTKFTNHLEGVGEQRMILICRALLEERITEAATLIRKERKVSVEKSNEIAQNILDWRRRHAAL